VIPIGAVFAAPPTRIIHSVAIAIYLSASLAVTGDVAVKFYTRVFEPPAAVLAPISVPGCKGGGSGGYQQTGA
jgi:hypothetical protein